MKTTHIPYYNKETAYRKIPYFYKERSADYPARAALVAKCPKHKANSESGPKPYSGPVNSRNPNVRAHGNASYTQTCVCGAERNQLVNGQHAETGPWYTPSKEKVK